MDDTCVEALRLGSRSGNARWAATMCAVLATVAIPASAQRTEFRDPVGNPRGYIQQEGNRSVLRDNWGIRMDTGNRKAVRLCIAIIPAICSDGSRSSDGKKTSLGGQKHALSLERMALKARYPRHPDLTGDCAYGRPGHERSSDCQHSPVELVAGGLALVKTDVIAIQREDLKLFPSGVASDTRCATTRADQSLCGWHFRCPTSLPT